MQYLAPAPSPAVTLYSQGRCGGVSSQWRPFAEERFEEIINRVDIAESGLFWNGYQVSQDEFETLLERVRAMEPTPGTWLLVYGEAPCNQVLQVRATLERTLDCSKKRACSELSEAELASMSPGPLAAPPCGDKCKASKDALISGIRE